MRDAKLLEVTTLDPLSIDTESRQRPASEAAVQSIIASYEALGVIKDEILVRKIKHQNGRLVLIAGLHRLTACQQMGIMVPAKIYDCTDEWAQLMEVDDNLAGAELNVLDTAVFLARRKEVYERIHPQTKAATGAALVAKRWDTTDNLSVVSFAKATAEKMGVHERKVFRLLAAGRNLDPTTVNALRKAPKPVSMSDLQELAKCGEPDIRARICKALAEGKAKSASDALKHIKSVGVKAPVKDPIDVAFIDLRDRFNRAPKAAKRRFVEELQDQLRDLLGDLDE